MTKGTGLSPAEAAAMAEFFHKAERDPKIWGDLFCAIYRNKGHTLHCVACDEQLPKLPLECPCCGSQEFVLLPPHSAGSDPILIKTAGGVFRWVKLRKKRTAQERCGQVNPRQ
jgi:hypothetical protein